MKRIPSAVLIIALVSALASHTGSVPWAGSMRQFQPIKTPEGPVAAVPEGFETIADIRPVDREIVRKFMEDLANNWNTPQMLQMLSEDFYDKSLFHDSMMTVTKVPFDAKLKILSIRSIRTLQQMVGEDPQYGRVCVSIVEVTALTQILLNDPEAGFVKLEGVNDYLLRVVDRQL